MSLSKILMLEEATVNDMDISLEDLQLYPGQKLTLW